MGMTIDNWVNLLLVLTCIALGLKLYHEFVKADQEERTVIKILCGIGSVVWLVDTVVSHIM